MNKFRCYLALQAVILILAGQAFGAPGDVNTPAADFTLNALGGGTETLSDHLGEVLLLNMFGYG